MRPDSPIFWHNNIWCFYSAASKSFLRIPSIFRKTAIFQNYFSWKCTRFEFLNQISFLSSLHYITFFIPLVSWKTAQYIDFWTFSSISEIIITNCTNCTCCIPDSTTPFQMQLLVFYCLWILSSFFQSFQLFSNRTSWSTLSNALVYFKIWLHI